MPVAEAIGDDKTVITMSFELNSDRSAEKNLSHAALDSASIAAQSKPSQADQPRPLQTDQPRPLPEAVNKSLPALAIDDKKASNVENGNEPDSTQDRYRWLEDADSAKTKSWVKNETDATEKYLAQIPERKQLENRIAKDYDYEQRYDMWKQNGRYYLWQQNGLKEQPLLCELDSFQGTLKPVIDPNTFSKGSVESVYQVQISNDGLFASLDLSEGGQDKTSRKYFDIKNQKFISDLPPGTSWPEFEPFHKRADLGTFTIRTQSNGINIGAGARSGETDTGTDTKPEAKTGTRAGEIDTNPKATIGTEAGKIDTSSGTSLDKGTATAPDRSPITGGKDNASDHQARPWSADGGDDDPTPIGIVMPDGSNRTYTVSHDNAPLHKLTVKDSKTGKESTLLPELPNEKLQEVKIVGDKIVAHYLKDACSDLKLFDLDGKFLQDVPLPGRGTVRSLSGLAGDNELIYTYSSFDSPVTVFHFDADTRKTEAQFTPKPNFDPKEFETEETFYKSKDGTPVHMFLVHKKGLELNGKNPTYLYGYGGFNVDITPFFGNGYVPWLQDGGVLAVANLRGDGEFGDKWHESGMLDNKQNVFDDFISAAQFLVDKKYTDKNHLAIGGASNGGLLVGATVVERPDLFAAAIPEVGLYDMVRFPKLGPGAVWEPEYGDPSKQHDYQNLLKYSPYHNLKPGTNYPPIMTMTAANDDRVSPPHSFKFVAAAQDAQGNKNNPVMLYVGPNRGHGHGMTTSEKVQEYSDKWAFLKKVMK